MNDLKLVWKLNSKSKKGITLIALIITIIILLILAGITISLMLGDNGLFNIAKKATTNYLNVQDQEYAYLNQIDNTINFDQPDDDNIEETQKELEIIIDNANSKGFKISISNIENDNLTFEYYVDDEKRETTKEKYYIISNIDLTQEHTVYVKSLNGNQYKGVSKKYHLKSEGIPRLSSNNSHILSEGSWCNNYKSSYSPTGVIHNFYAFDGNLGTYAAPTTSGYATVGTSIGYDFEEPVCMYETSGKIRMLGYKIQASNDNKIWQDIVTSSSPASESGDNFKNEISNGKKYRYWRLYISGGQRNSSWGAMVYELKFNYIKVYIED